MTRRSVRPRWPACAWRNASPWRRKIAATSSAGMTSRGSGRRGPLHSQSVERAGGVADRGGCDLGISCRGRQIVMAEEHLDRADIGARFEQMGGEAVPQGMDGDRLAELRRCPSGAASPLQHTGVERPALVMTGKQPMGGPGLPPITPQHAEQLRRQHYITIPAALAPFAPE